MRVLMMADANSVHTKRWAVAMVARGVETAVFSLNPFIKEEGGAVTGYNVYVPGSMTGGISSKSLLRKVSYLFYIAELKRVIKKFKPNIVHAHYASSYGTLGALSGFRPLLISLWGSDVYDFPRRNFLAKSILKYNLSAASLILSTSNTMAKEAGIYTGKEIRILPFGIDLEKFSSSPRSDQKQPGEIVTGTVKALEREYGIDILIQSFAKVCERNPDQKIRLKIAGDGSLEKQLKDLATATGFGNRIEFAGKLNHHDVPSFLRQLDIFVALSVSESFGVSVIEASASELPVVVSDAGGLPEVVDNGITGLIVPVGDVEQAAAAIGKLVNDADLRVQLGVNGRKKVEKMYNWRHNVDEMVAIYARY